MNPGDVFVSNMGSGKPRPWVVIWVDDDLRCALCAALTTQAQFPGVMPVYHPNFNAPNGTYVAGWTQVIALDSFRIGPGKFICNIESAQLRKIEAHLAAFMDLRK